MEIVLQDRLFLFMFGGRESTYKADQLAYKNVYECRVVRRLAPASGLVGQLVDLVIAHGQNLHLQSSGFTGGPAALVDGDRV
eukprot:6472165-Amphidinium_carterae.1